MSLDSIPSQSRPFLDRALRATRLAAGFLTVIPFRWRGPDPDGDDLAASRFAYPAVGAAIGLTLAALSEILQRMGIDPSLAAFLLLVAGVVITGGLHLDGLADASDGLFLWGGPERRLAVMRDPHVGSFGVVAIVLALLGKYALLAHLAGAGRSRALLAAALAARTAILVAAGSSRYARPEGTGRFLVDAATPRDAIAAAVAIPLVSCLILGLPGLAGGLTALLIAWGLARMASARIGGVTGDILGAVVELGELGFLVAVGSYRA